MEHAIEDADLLVIIRHVFGRQFVNTFLGEHGLFFQGVIEGMVIGSEGISTNGALLLETVIEPTMELFYFTAVVVSTIGIVLGDENLKRVAMGDEGIAVDPCGLLDVCILFWI